MPTASVVHFLVWLLAAAPLSFCSFDSAVHFAFAFFLNFVMKLLSAAPASGFPSLLTASVLQVAFAPTVVASAKAAARMIFFTGTSVEFEVHGGNLFNPVPPNLLPSRQPRRLRAPSRPIIAKCNVNGM